jgi:hypothetical protein
MLKPESAKQQLKAFEVKYAGARRLQRIAALPETLRSPAYALYGRDENGRTPTRGYELTEGMRLKQVERLEALDRADQERIFDSLLPGLGAAVWSAWQLFPRLPYQNSYDRKAFRAPNAAEIVRKPRLRWLDDLLRTVASYEPDVAWLAAWAPYLGYWTDTLGILFAGVIEAGGPTGDAVFEVLTASACGAHPIGAMGRHVTRGLLVASRPEGWTFIEKMLLAAQRQEGLRQVILETIDEAHPGAFLRMLRLIAEHDLTRFSATVRALCVWFGYQPEAIAPNQWKQVIQSVARFLEDDAACADAISGDDMTQQFLALWTLAFTDAEAATGTIVRAATDPRDDRRMMATRLLTLIKLPAAQRALMAQLDDPNLQVAEIALSSFRYDPCGEYAATDLFERLERLYQRYPAERKSEMVSIMPRSLGERAPQRLLPYLPHMGCWERKGLAQQLAASIEKDPEARSAVFNMIGDLSPDVRAAAFQAFGICHLTAGEIVSVEKLLTRTAGDLRRDALALLLKQNDAEALQSANRLIAAKNPAQRTAGLELAREMVRAERSANRCRELAAQYRQQRPRHTEAETALVNELLNVQQEIPTLENGLCLYDPTQRTRPGAPRAIPHLQTCTTASTSLLAALHELIDRHRETPMRLPLNEFGNGGGETLLGNVGWRFPKPDLKIAREQDLERLPLRELWEEWWRSRPSELRDADGYELYRVMAEQECASRLKHTPVLDALLQWLLHFSAPDGVVDFLLDATENQFAGVPKDLLERSPRPDSPYDIGWRGSPHRVAWLTVARRHREFYPERWTAGQHARLYSLVRWLDEPGTNVPRHRPQLNELLRALRAGKAVQADLLDHLIGPRDVSYRYAYPFRLFESLKSHSGRVPTALCRQFPELQAAIDLCRQRLIEIEQQRGELPTAASRPVVTLLWTGGAETLVRLLMCLGREPFSMQTDFYDDVHYTRKRVYSELIRKTAPLDTDTPEMFAAKAHEAGISTQWLIELALFAPQWARHVEHAVGWPLLAEGAWWLRAHSRDTGWGSQFHLDQEIREAWMTQACECLSMPVQSLADGAVDVVWFQRVYEALGPERWATLERAARYGSDRGGQKRAQLWAGAMLGKVTRAELVARIVEKRNQEAVRALGLLPLPAGPEREPEVLARYRVLQEFLRGSREFGSQRQASEKLAVSIGMENLARTAGYLDPIRLEWAMESAAVADLARGPITVTTGAVTVTLAINGLGRPELAASKSGKPLKAIPDAARKDLAVADLIERKHEIERQCSRMRRSLEQAMCRGDRFTGAELRCLLAHPVLAPMLRALVFIGDTCSGYPIDGGRALESYNGSVHPLHATTELRIAHPYDLLGTEVWPQWQRDCFLRERIQPFKQVFRELYVQTGTESDDGVRSRRYEGHQVNGKQAMALLGSRGWTVNEAGMQRAYPEHGITVQVSLFHGYTTPAEVEGITLEHVSFCPRGEWKALPLEQIPPHVYSEVMRDLDLVVSVAHQGGVDPEASASTVEMRTALLREALLLLKIGNVRFQGAHALIDGEIGTYSVHLGSAVVHRQPGGHLCIVPVHSQHRGRLFLPFADDDPKTAEVISKVLLLARDQEIKDPIILEQILARR